MENLKKTVLFVLTSTSAKVISTAMYIFAGIPLPINEVLMLAVSSLTDLLTAIGFAREEGEPTIKSFKKSDHKLIGSRTLFHSFCLLGMIEGVAVVFTFLVTMQYFGF